MENLYAQKVKKKKKREKKETFSPVSERNSIEALSYFFDGQKAFMLDNLDAALASFKKSLSLDPNNGAANFKIGQILLNKGKYNDALLYARRARAIDDSNEYYYQLEANVFSSLGDFSAAASTYEELIKKTGTKGEYLFELGALYLYSSKYDEAIDAYERAKIFYGPNEQITKQKQSIYLKQNNLDDAIREGKELVDAYPGNADYKLGLAEILISNSRDKEAEKLLVSIRTEHPENSKVDIILSEIYRKRGEFKKSIEILGVPFSDPLLNFSAKISMLSGYLTLLPNDTLQASMVKIAEKLLMAHPNEVESYVINGDIQLNLKRKDIALAYYKKALSVNRSNFKVWQNIVTLESEYLQYDSVIVHANEALEYFPNQSIFYYYLGMGNYINKNYEEAIQAYENGKKFSKKDPKLYSVFSGQLGDIYHHIEEFEKSYQSYDDALKANPTNDHVLNNYSYFLSVKNKNMEKALKMSTTLIKNYPDNATYLDTHGWVLYVIGDYKGAYEFLKKAVLDSDNGTIIEHYGDVLYRLNRVNEAVQQWQKAKETKDELTEYIDKKIADRKLYE